MEMIIKNYFNITLCFINYNYLKSKTSEYTKRKYFSIKTQSNLVYVLQTDIVAFKISLFLLPHNILRTIYV